MRPYYEDEACQIFHGDCREILPALEPESADAVVTDPPFNVGFEYGTGYDDKMALDAYGDFLRGAVSESQRALRPGGWSYWWVAMMHCHLYHKWFPEGWRIFASTKDFVQILPIHVQYSWDPVVFWRKDGPKGERGKSARDWHLARTSRHVLEKRRGAKHPCRRPIDAATYIVDAAAKPGETVLDPFMGSGTTLLAAKNLGRKAIGIEREEQWCEASAERLAQGVLDLGDCG